MTLMLMSNLRCVPVTRSGASAAISSTRRPRYANGSFSLTVTRPSPSCNRTRAIAFFRRPVPRLSSSANLQVSFFVEGKRLWFLRLVPVVRPRVNAKALQHIGSQRVPLQHSAHRRHNWEGGIDLLGLIECAGAKAVGVAGVARVQLARALIARDLDLGGVDDYDVVARVQVRREGRLVLARENSSHS